MRGIYFTHKLLDFCRLKIYGLNKKRINKMIKVLMGHAAAQPIEAIGIFLINYSRRRKSEKRLRL